MSMTMGTMQLMTKEFVFKKDETGTSKKSGGSFRVVELHDPTTLENTPFFIREGQNVSTVGIQFKDKVVASFGMDIIYGKAQLVLQSLIKK